MLSLTLAETAWLLSGSGDRSADGTVGSGVMRRKLRVRLGECDVVGSFDFTVLAGSAAS